MLNVKFLFAWLTVVVVFFAGEWLLYDTLLHDFFAIHLVKYDGLVYSNPRLFSALIANLSISLVVVMCVYKSHINHSAKKGAMVGLVICFLIGVYYDMVIHSYLNFMDYSAVIADVSVNTILGTIAGLLAGLIFSRSRILD